MMAKFKLGTSKAMEGNCDAVSIGKLHFIDDQAPTGFTQQINPLNVVGGVRSFRINKK